MSNSYQRPFLKWAGGKYRLLDRIFAKLPKGNRLIEPFVGAGVVFINADFEQNILCDVNQDLINLYQTLQNHDIKFIRKLDRYFKPENNQPDNFYRLREKFNRTKDPIERSCLFIYLNRHCYNGLCRYNRSGHYNVPFGRYKKPLVPIDALNNFQQQTQQATFICCDFESAIDQAEKNDVIYCDPPYVPLSNSSSFTSYHHKDFGEDEQQRLADAIRKAHNRGAKILISNHDTPVTRKLYKGSKITSFDVMRFISYNGNRNRVRELLALFD